MNEAHFEWDAIDVGPDDFSERWLMLPDHPVAGVDAEHWGLTEDGADEVCTATLNVRSRSAAETRALADQLIDLVAEGAPALQRVVTVFRPG